MTRQVQSLICRMSCIVALLCSIMYPSNAQLVCVGMPVHPALFAQYLQHGIYGPWVGAWDSRSTLGRGAYVQLVPRIPYAQAPSECIAEDRQRIPGLCPYPVALALDIPPYYDIARIFDVVVAVHDSPLAQYKTLRVLPGGTVVVVWADSSITLGRRKLLQRFHSAETMMMSPAWVHGSGHLDMRYHDGGAWKAAAASQR